MEDTRMRKLIRRKIKETMVSVGFKLVTTVMALVMTAKELWNMRETRKDINKMKRMWSEWANEK
jgi:signal transduction histidine kinase